MTQKDTVRALIDAQGRLYSEEAGADISRDTPLEWFHWLLTAILLSARISAGNATQASAALRKAGLHRVDSILASDRARRVEVLNRNGYARFDNIGADQIRDAAELVRDRWKGDLCRLAEGADAATILRRLTEVKGIGKVGAEIFAREAQLVWDALYPRLDARAADMAEDLGLPRDAHKLAEMAGTRADYVRLATALVRAALDGPADSVRAA